MKLNNSNWVKRVFAAIQSSSNQSVFVLLLALCSATVYAAESPIAASINFDNASSSNGVSNTACPTEEEIIAAKKAQDEGLLRLQADPGNELLKAEVEVTSLALNTLLDQQDSCQPPPCPTPDEIAAGKEEIDRLLLMLRSDPQNPVLIKDVQMASEELIRLWKRQDSCQPPPCPTPSEIAAVRKKLHQLIMLLRMNPQDSALVAEAQLASAELDILLKQQKFCSKP